MKTGAELALPGPSLHLSGGTDETCTPQLKSAEVSSVIVIMIIEMISVLIVVENPSRKDALFDKFKIV